MRACVRACVVGLAGPGHRLHRSLLRFVCLRNNRTQNAGCFAVCPGSCVCVCVRAFARRSTRLARTACGWLYGNQHVQFISTINMGGYYITRTLAMRLLEMGDYYSIRRTCCANALVSSVGSVYWRNTLMCVFVCVCSSVHRFVLHRSTGLCVG